MRSNCPYSSNIATSILAFSLLLPVKLSIPNFLASFFYSFLVNCRSISLLEAISQNFYRKEVMYQCKKKSDEVKLKVITIWGATEKG